MKAFLVSLNLAATLLVVIAQPETTWKFNEYLTKILNDPRICFQHRPTFAPPPHRFRRDSQATATATLGQGSKTPTLNFDYQGDILKNKNGELTGGLSAQKAPSQDWDASGRLEGGYQIGNGHLTGGVYKPLTGPDRNPTFSAGYNHNIWESQNGRISAGVSAMKFPHQDWQPHYEIRGTWNIPG